MKCTNPGHTYELANFEDKSKSQTLQFIDKQKVDGTFKTIADGTSNEEVLEMLIDRMYWLQTLASCRENAIVITKLEEALMWLNKRTADRMKRGVEGTPAK